MVDDAPVQAERTPRSGRTTGGQLDGLSPAIPAQEGTCPQAAVDDERTMRGRAPWETPPVVVVRAPRRQWWPAAGRPDGGLVSRETFRRSTPGQEPIVHASALGGGCAAMCRGGRPTEKTAPGSSETQGAAWSRNVSRETELARWASTGARPKGDMGTRGRGDGGNGRRPAPRRARPLCRRRPISPRTGSPKSWSSSPSPGPRTLDGVAIPAATRPILHRCEGPRPLRAAHCPAEAGGQTSEVGGRRRGGGGRRASRRTRCEAANGTGETLGRRVRRARVAARRELPKGAGRGVSMSNPELLRSWSPTRARLLVKASVDVGRTLNRRARLAGSRCVEESAVARLVAVGPPGERPHGRDGALAQLRCRTGNLTQVAGANSRRWRHGRTGQPTGRVPTRPPHGLLTPPIGARQAELMA